MHRSPKPDRWVRVLHTSPFSLKGIVLKTYTFKGERLVQVEQAIELDIRAPNAAEAKRLATEAIWAWPEITDKSITNACVVSDNVVDVLEVSRVASVVRKN
jgi:hypothetical protein